MATTKYIVRTFLNDIEVDTQYVNKSTELEDTGFVTFNKEKKLEANGGVVLEGGTTTDETPDDHQKARDLFESYAFNILAYAGEDDAIRQAYVDYTISMRDEYGVKFQTVVPYPGRNIRYNHEGIIQVGNEVKGDNPNALVYWVAGAQAGCRVQDSVMAKAYDGRYEIIPTVTRAELEQAIDLGVFTFHKVAGEYLVLKDINSLIKIEEKDREKKNNDFKQNQSIRVLDTVVIESAKVFNGQFLGKVPNDDLGRISLRSELLKIRNELQRIRAIADYDENNLNIIQGKGLGDVIGTDAIRPLNAMERFFLTISFLSL